MKDAFGVSKAYYADHDPVVQALTSAEKHAAELGQMAKKPAPPAQVVLVPKTVAVLPKGKMAAIAGGSAAGGLALGSGATLAIRRKRR